MRKVRWPGANLRARFERVNYRRGIKFALAESNSEKY